MAELIHSVKDALLAGNTALPSPGFLRERQIRPALLPVAHSTFWQMIKDGRFPAPLKLSEKITVFRASEVIAWIERQGTK